MKKEKPMRSYTAPIPERRKLEATPGVKIMLAWKFSIREMLALLSALTTAIGIVLLSIWMVGMGIDNFLGAATWGLGFIFLGMAVDNRGSLALIQASTGVAMLSLACLQSGVSSDFTIASGVLLATWVAHIIYRQLR
jgi:hypothetical protein